MCNKYFIGVVKYNFFIICNYYAQYTSSNASCIHLILPPDALFTVVMLTKYLLMYTFFTYWDALTNFWAFNNHILPFSQKLLAFAVTKTVGVIRCV